ncbi:hypothetical protein QQX98_003324 [Neonectria punicea]|uniref:NB-ARC domain-containing protein n=1 Tax=Neonectria punicea TaxID=979145 RepID=A0ABR1HEW1_9HYPO
MSDSDFSKRSKRLPLPCYSIDRDRNEFFHGRHEVLDLIHGVLMPLEDQDLQHGHEKEPYRSPLKSFVICGMGGMGKTEIALEYVHRHKAEFEAIFWISGSSESQFKAGFLDMAIKLDLLDDNEVFYPGLATTKQIVHAWLKNPVHTISSDPIKQDSYVKWLIVFDDLDDPELLADFCGTGTVLVTTRNPAVKEGIFTQHPSLDLPPMPIEEGSLLFQKVSDSKTEQDCMKKCVAITTQLGGLPLAIVQMGYAIRCKQLSLRQFIELYDVDAKTLQEVHLPGLTKCRTILSIWNIDSLAPPALALLQVISVLHPDAVSEVILTNEPEKAILEDYPKDLNKVDRLRKVQKYLPHIATIKQVLQEKNVSIMQPDIKVCALFNEASWYYILQQSGYGLLEGEQFAVLSQHVLEKSHGSNDQNLFTKLLANSYRYQGIIGTHMNSSSAITSCKKWISVLVDRIKRFNDPEDIGMLPIAYNEVGMALMWVPDKEEAEKSWIQSCEALKQVTKPDELVFPFPWVHRALVAAYYSGDCHAAESLVAPILKKREEKLGKDDTSTIETGLILVFMASVLKTTCGDFSIQASLGYYRLAVDEFDRGLYKDVRKLLEKCVSFYGDVPWNKPQSARCLWKLGRTLQVEGGDDNETEGSKLLEQAMKLRHELAPDDKREEPELTDQDWDDLVFYFFR